MSSYLCINLEKQKNTFDSFTKFIKACFIIIIFMLVVFHLTNNSTSFCYSYIAAEVQFQFMKKKKL